VFSPQFSRHVMEWYLDRPQPLPSKFIEIILSPDAVHFAYRQCHEITD
jgi:hypothetical protein